MAIDLEDLVPALKREITPLDQQLAGADPFLTVTDETMLGYLSDAFWEGRLNRMFIGFDIVNDTIVPISGTTDMTRDWQQAVVLWAGYRLVLNDLRNVQSAFKAKAGPVEYETQRSATVLKGVLDVIVSRMNRLIYNLGAQNTAIVYDAIIERSLSMADLEQWWVR